MPGLKGNTTQHNLCKVTKKPQNCRIKFLEVPQHHVNGIKLSSAINFSCFSLFMQLLHPGAYQENKPAHIGKIPAHSFS